MRGEKLMAELFAYLDGFGTGGSLTKSVIIAKAPTGSTVTCTKGDVVKRATEKNGEWRFNGLDIGTWTLRAEMSGQQPATLNCEIKEFGVYRVELSFFLSAADFTFTGVKGTDYEIVQDDGTVIPEGDYGKYKNWKAKVFTTITVTPKKDCEIDVFEAGAGGGASNRNYDNAGGGGYTMTKKNVKLTAGTEYQITIGAGGPRGSKGGFTSGFGVTAAGGDNGDSTGAGSGQAGHGGSGGAPFHDSGKQKGAVDGNDASGGAYQKAGQGQRNRPGPNGETGSTREFGEPDGDLYCSGGNYNETNEGLTGPNSGHGGNNREAGESGILIFRNAREGVA